MVVLYAAAKENIFTQLKTGPKRFRELANETGLDDNSLAKNLAEILASETGGVEVSERLSVTPETNRKAFGDYVRQLGEARKEHEEYGRVILDDITRFKVRTRLWKAFLDDTERDNVPNRYLFKTYFVTKDRGSAYTLN